MRCPQISSAKSMGEAQKAESSQRKEIQATTSRERKDTPSAGLREHTFMKYFLEAGLFPCVPEDSGFLETTKPGFQGSKKPVSGHPVRGSQP